MARLGWLPNNTVFRTSGGEYGVKFDRDYSIVGPDHFMAQSIPEEEVEPLFILQGTLVRLFLVPHGERFRVLDLHSPERMQSPFNDRYKVFDKHSRIKSPGGFLPRTFVLWIREEPVELGSEQSLVHATERHLRLRTCPEPGG